MNLLDKYLLPFALAVTLSFVLLVFHVAEATPWSAESHAHVQN